jgi:hypothetical protein
MSVRPGLKPFAFLKIFFAGLRSCASTENNDKPFSDS